MLGLLTVVLTVAGPVDAVISRSIDTTPERAEDLLGRVVAALVQAGIEVRDPAQTRRLLPAGTVPSDCAARRACVRQLGVALGSRAVVGVDVGHVTRQMAVNLEAISTADGQRLAQHSFAISSAGYPAGIEQQLGEFTRALALALGPRDAPLVAKLEPEPVKVAEPVPILAAAPSRSPGPALLGGAAVIAAVVGISLAAVGASTAGHLRGAAVTYQGQPASTLSRAQADQLAATANGQFTGAAVGGGLAVALGAASLFWWSFE